MQRMGMVIGLKPDKVEARTRLHANGWRDIPDRTRACHIRQCAILPQHAESALFGFRDCRGTDFATDAALMAADPKTEAWRAVRTPGDDPLPGRKDGPCRAKMQKVCPHD